MKAEELREETGRILRARSVGDAGQLLSALVTIVDAHLATHGLPPSSAMRIRLSDCRTAQEVRREEIRRHPVRYLFWSAVLRLEEAKDGLVHQAHAYRHPALHAECCSTCAKRKERKNHGDIHGVHRGGQPGRR